MPTKQRTKQPAPPDIPNVSHFLAYPGQLRNVTVTPTPWSAHGELDIRGIVTGPDGHEEIPIAIYWEPGTPGRSERPLFQVGHIHGMMPDGLPGRWHRPVSREAQGGLLNLAFAYETVVDVQRKYLAAVDEYVINSLDQAAQSWTEPGGTSRKRTPNFPLTGTFPISAQDPHLRNVHLAATPHNGSQLLNISATYRDPSGGLRDGMELAYYWKPEHVGTYPTPVLQVGADEYPLPKDMHEDDPDDATRFLSLIPHDPTAEVIADGIVALLEVRSQADRIRVQSMEVATEYIAAKLTATALENTWLHRGRAWKPNA